MRYTAAPGPDSTTRSGTNPGKDPEGKPGWEIDVNEGHWPNTINASLHRDGLPSQSKSWRAPEAMLFSYFRNNGKPSSQYDNRVFITRTRDFKTFRDATLYFDRGFASIDAVMKPDPAQRNWVMIIKCMRDKTLKTMPGRNLWITRSTGMDTGQPHFAFLAGPIPGYRSPMFNDPSPHKSMAEGPSLPHQNNCWGFVWDETAGGHLQLATSSDLQIWTHPKDTKSPHRAQHGTLFLAPKSSFEWMKP